MSAVAHYIAGVLDRESMVEIVEGLWQSAESVEASERESLGLERHEHARALQRSGIHDLLRLLGLRPQGAAASIKQFDERERPFQLGSRRLRSLQFQTIRHDGGGNRGNSSGNAFAITFPNPVSGPLAFGYGSHFGLGLFVPATLSANDP